MFSTHYCETFLSKFYIKSYKKRYEIEFPLVYPKSVQRDYKFEKQMTPNKLERIGMKAESLARSFVYLGFKKTINRIRKKVNGR